MEPDGPTVRIVECLDDSAGIVDYPSGDYFTDILDTYLSTGRARRGVVGDATQAAHNVAVGSQQLSSSSEQVSQGATEQAAAAGNDRAAPRQVEQVQRRAAHSGMLSERPLAIDAFIASTISSATRPSARDARGAVPVRAHSRKSPIASTNIAFLSYGDVSISGSASFDAFVCVSECSKRFQFNQPSVPVTVNPARFGR